MKSRALPGIKPPDKDDDKKAKKYVSLLEDHGFKAFTIIQEKETVKPEHIGRYVKNMYSLRATKFRIYAYVVREPLHRDYVLTEYEGATFSMPLTECKLIPVKKKRAVKTKPKETSGEEAKLKRPKKTK